MLFDNDVVADGEAKPSSFSGRLVLSSEPVSAFLISQDTNKK